MIAMIYFQNVTINKITCIALGSYGFIVYSLSGCHDRWVYLSLVRVFFHFLWFSCFLSQLTNRLVTRAFHVTQAKLPFRGRLTPNQSLSIQNPSSKHTLNKPEDKAHRDYGPYRPQVALQNTYLFIKFGFENNVLWVNMRIILTKH